MDDIQKQIQLNEKNRYFIETYGCQMNESDSEIINGILQKAGYKQSDNIEDANIILINTCSIRENAENKIWKRLEYFRAIKKNNKEKKDLIVGVLGCMASRLKDQLVDKNKVVDVIAGPDSYKDLPRLIQSINHQSHNYQINVQLSIDETYADVTPVRTNDNKIQAYVTIMRGCNNMCSYCIVPFTRGRERSRPIESILQEVINLRDQGYKEITLLGQNVNSYHDISDSSIQSKHENSPGFSELFKKRQGCGSRFAQLLESVATLVPEIRIRFTSPHPKDFPEQVLDCINQYPNICKNIHLPVQSGNNEILQKMRRNYTREAYLSLVNQIQVKIPGITLSSDFICGFCGENDTQFQETIDIMEKVQFEQAYLFAYSQREKTHAHRQMIDDVPDNVKQIRLQKLIDCFHKNLEITTKQELGRLHLVLIEGQAKYQDQLKGRTDTNRIAIIQQQSVKQHLNIQDNEILQTLLINNEKNKIIQYLLNTKNQQQIQIQQGDFIICQVMEVSKRTLFCQPLVKSSITEFAKLSQNKPFISCNQ